MMSLWMAPDWGAGKIWGLQPRSALVASGRQQILHLFYFFFKFVLLFYFIFCLFLAFSFFSCHLLLFQQGPWQPMPLPVGCHLRSPLRAGDRCQELQVSVNRREAARYVTEQGLGALLYRRAISVERPKGNSFPTVLHPHDPAWGPQNGRSALQFPPPRCYATSRA